MYPYETRKLTFQLVPKTSWYNNLRSQLPNWPAISAKIRKVGHCEICGCKTSDLDAHEVWKYDDATYTQTLDRIIAVCKPCHNTIHIGHANISGKAEEAIAQYIKVNKITPMEAEKDIKDAFFVWDQRSLHNWIIDEAEIKQRVKDLTGIDCDIKDTDDKFYVKVAYADKEAAKAFGAHWDGTNKMWYFKTQNKKNAWIQMKKKK